MSPWNSYHLSPRLRALGQLKSPQGEVLVIRAEKELNIGAGIYGHVHRQINPQSWKLRDTAAVWHWRTGKEQTPKLKPFFTGNLSKEGNC